MKIPGIWCFVCWVFGFHSLSTLVEESNEVVYQKGNETEPVNYLACEKLTKLYPKKLYPNKTQIDLKELADDLYRHFKSLVDHYNDHRRNSIEINQLILNQTKSKGYLILNEKVCLIANDEKEFKCISQF